MENVFLNSQLLFYLWLVVLFFLVLLTISIVQELRTINLSAKCDFTGPVLYNNYYYGKWKTITLLIANKEQFYDKHS